MLVHDYVLKRPITIRKWKEFKYVIYVPIYFGLLSIDIALSYQTILLIVIPPLMAAQYRFIKRDWYIILFTTIATIPIIIYGSFVFGIADYNLLKDIPSTEQALDINYRLSLLTSSRIGSLFLHHCMPRILSISAIDFLIAAIIQRNNYMLKKQRDLSLEVKESIEKQNKIQSAVIEELASVIETRDVNTGEHVRRTKQYVTILCNNLAKEDKYKDILTEELINKIISAAPLHDIGKIAVSDTILLKPGKLSDDEFEKMKIHTTKGGEMVKTFFTNFEDDSFAKEAYEIALYHHEKWDGNGYPNKLKGEEIPLAARIMAIADVYDALVSERVYKKKISPEDAFNILLEEAGHHFDPNLIEVLKSIKEEFINAAK